MLFRVSWDHLLSATSQQPALRSVFLGWEGIPCSSANTVSKKPTNYLHRDHDVGTGGIFCGLGHSLSATCQASLFGSFPVSVFRRLADVPDAPALRSPLAIGRIVNGELFGTFASI